MRGTSLRERPEALVAALARTGDKDAFAELVVRRQSWLRGFLRQMTADKALADDLAQQTLLQAWRSVDALRDPRKFAPWLKRIAVTMWLKHQRRNDPLQDRLDDTEIEQSTHDTPDVSWDLSSALARLSPTSRACVVLSYSEGFTHEEIAKTLKLPLGTVKSNIRRATQQLRSFLTLEDAREGEVRDE